MAVNWLVMKKINFALLRDECRLFINFVYCSLIFNISVLDCAARNSGEID